LFHLLSYTTLRTTLGVPKQSITVLIAHLVDSTKFGAPFVFTFSWKGYIEVASKIEVHKL